MAVTLVDSHAARVALFVTGGIAAYKACEVLRGLQKAATPRRGGRRLVPLPNQ